MEEYTTCQVRRQNTGGGVAHSRWEGKSPFTGCKDALQLPARYAVALRRGPGLGLRVGARGRASLPHGGTALPLDRDCGRHLQPCCRGSCSGGRVLQPFPVATGRCLSRSEMCRSSVPWVIPGVPHPECVGGWRPCVHGGSAATLSEVTENWKGASSPSEETRNELLHIPRAEGSTSLQGGALAAGCAKEGPARGGRAPQEDLRSSPFCSDVSLWPAGTSCWAGPPLWSWTGQVRSREEGGGVACRESSELAQDCPGLAFSFLLTALTVPGSPGDSDALPRLLPGGRTVRTRGKPWWLRPDRGGVFVVRPPGRRGQTLSCGVRVDAPGHPNVSSHFSLAFSVVRVFSANASYLFSEESTELFPS